MKDFIINVVWIIFILCLIFLFNGTPDVWDMLHARTMEYLQSKP